MTVKVKATKNAAAPIDAVTGDLDKDVKLAQAWLGFREAIIQFMDKADSAAVELGFESSLDSKTHYTFNADEIVFVNDIKVGPTGNVIFSVPFGSKEKSFGFSEAELINVKYDGNEEQLNTVINRYFREAFHEFSDIPTVTMLERKYIAPMAGMAAIFNDATGFINKIELTKDRSKLYAKISNFGIF